MVFRRSIYIFVQSARFKNTLIYKIKVILQEIAQQIYLPLKWKKDFLSWWESFKITLKKKLLTLTVLCKRSFSGSKTWFSFKILFYLIQDIREVFLNISVSSYILSINLFASVLNFLRKIIILEFPNLVICINWHILLKHKA